jgi:hypothetical protein
MKLSEFRDNGGRVVFVDVVVLEMAVVFICLGRTAAVTALMLASAVIALEKYMVCCMKVMDTVESCD